MENAINLLLTFIGNIISVWIIFEVMEKLLEVKMPRPKRRKFFWLIVTLSTLSSYFLGF